MDNEDGGVLLRPVCFNDNGDNKDNGHTATCGVLIRLSLICVAFVLFE